MKITKEEFIDIIKDYDESVRYDYFNLDTGKVKYNRKCEDYNKLLTDEVSEIRLFDEVQDGNIPIFMNIDICYNIRNNDIHTGQLIRFLLHRRQLKKVG